MAPYSNFLSCFYVVLCMHLMACATIISPQQQYKARLDYDMGVASLQQADHRGALRSLLRAIQEDPTLAEAHQALGLVYHTLGRLNEAEYHYVLALHLKDNFSEAHNNRGILQLDRQQYDAAIVSFQKALSDIFYNTPSLAEGNMGWAYYLKGDVANATVHLNNAVTIDPKFCRGYEWLWRIAFDQKDAQAIFKQAQRFEQFCLNDKDIAKTIATVYVHEKFYYQGLGSLLLGDKRQAKRFFERCTASSSGLNTAYGDLCQKEHQKIAMKQPMSQSSTKKP